MRPSSTARRYAEAAFDVARQDGDVAAWVRELEELVQALDDPLITEYFRNPDVSRDEKLRAVAQLFEQVHPHALNLLRVLVSRQRVYLLPAIFREFVALQREAEGIAEAHVTVAREIDSAERNAIAQRLGQVTGKRIEIQTHVDPSILGGVIVRIGDKLIDASVAGKLQRLRQQMAV